jgi:maltose/moltooligosaccharide transporter
LTSAAPITPAPRARPAGFFLLISLPATAMGFALSVQISVLSWLLATRYGLKIDEIGLVWAAGPLAGIFGQVIVGALSDRVWLWGGRRRPFIIGGGVLAALALLLLPQIGVIAAALGLPGVFGVAIAVALALDLAVNVGFTPTRALIGDVTGDGTERTRGYSWMQVVSGSFGVGAYAIGALFGNDMLITVAVVIVLAFSVVPTLLITEPPREERKATATKSVQSRSWRALAWALSPLWALFVYDVYALTIRLTGATPAGWLAELACALATLALVAHAFIGRPDADSAFRQTVAASALCWLGVQPIFVFMVSFLQDRMPALDAVALGQVTGLSFLTLNGVAALAPLLLGRLAQHFGVIRVHAASIMLMAAGYVAIWLFATTPAVLYMIMAVCGIGWGSIVSLPFAIMSQRVDRDRLGLFMGLFNLSVVLPQLVTSLGIGSFVAAVDDKGALFALCALFLALSAWLWSRIPDGSAPRAAPLPGGAHH